MTRKQHALRSCGDQRLRTKGNKETHEHRHPHHWPAADELLVRFEATRINLSDLGLLFGAAEIGTTKVSGTPARPVLTALVYTAAASTSAKCSTASA